MTLGFTETINGKPNFFIEKIWEGFLLNQFTGFDYVEYFNQYQKKFEKNWDGGSGEVRDQFKPKLHTIRRDEHNRWKAGMDIHMVINNRTKDRFQFAPVVKCVSVQKIEIKYNQYMGEPIPIVIIDSIEYTYDPYFQFSDSESLEVIRELAINDGFDSVEDFFTYFNTDFKGKIIHWTDLKY